MQVCTQACAKDGVDRVREPGQPVDAGDQDILDAALAQVI
jgi:hypothetical protein